MSFFRNILLHVFCLIAFISCSQKKINGVSLVSPPRAMEDACLDSLQQINANWVAVIPYAFTPQNSPIVKFESSHQWWGEKQKGVIKLIDYAKKENLKVMLKPHIWCRGIWIGDFTLNNESDWKLWEADYIKYITTYAKIAQDKNVDLFCIGTELKQVVINRPGFFKRLIKEVKNIYKGEITYAANWDNVEKVDFWKDLDYIGVDAYYSLSDKKQPTVDNLNKAWQLIKEGLQKLSEANNKPILFTEYGFESCDFNTKETWGSNGKYDVNEKAQAIAYQSYFESFYKENWFAGGFLWKWHVTPRTMRNKNKAFTPQGKEAENVIKKEFKKH